LRCCRSPAYFLERYCQVYDATARVWLPFGLWPAQRDVLVDLEQHRLTVILKARQLGLSWLVVGWALWLMLFQPAATVLFFSKRDQEAVHLLAFRLRGMLDRLPEWLRPVLVADNDHNIELANGSVGMAFPTTGGRSYTTSLVVVDEADFAGASGADNLDALLAAVKPTIDAGGRLTLLSTADKSKPQSACKQICGAGNVRLLRLPSSASAGRSHLLHHPLHPLRMRMQIPRLRADIGVPQDRRQRGDVSLVLHQEVRRQAMPQSVRGHAELDPHSPRGLGDHPLHIAGLECAMGSTEAQKLTGYIRSHLKVSLQRVPSLRR